MKTRNIIFMIFIFLMTFNVLAIIPISGSIDWVKLKLNKYPELTWLADDHVHKTQENVSSIEGGWSTALYGKKFDEFERTMLSLLILDWLYEGGNENYLSFTASQKENKLTKESFDKLHQFTLSVLKTPHLKDLLERNLILGDLGKTKKARDLAKEAAHIADHDEFLYKCLQNNPTIFPSFMQIKKEDQNFIKEMTGLIHLGHVTHVEGGPEMFQRLEKSSFFKKTPQLFKFEILTHYCDVGAALGHITNKGSLTFNENLYQTLSFVSNSLEKLVQGKKETLQYYLEQRRSLLGLNFKNDPKFILTRIGTMTRLYTKEEGDLLLNTWSTLLTSSERIFIENNFNPLTEQKMATPTYVPAVLVNIINKINDRSIAYKVVLKDAIPFVLNVIEKYKSGNTSFPYKDEQIISFNRIAGDVKTDPNILNNAKFDLDKDGMVTLLPSNLKEQATK